jgi:hypothetical protein
MRCACLNFISIILIGICGLFFSCNEKREKVLKKPKPTSLNAHIIQSEIHVEADSLIPNTISMHFSGSQLFIRNIFSYELAHLTRFGELNYAVGGRTYPWMRIQYLQDKELFVFNLNDTFDLSKNNRLNSELYKNGINARYDTLYITTRESSRRDTLMKIPLGKIEFSYSTELHQYEKKIYALSID